MPFEHERALGAPPDLSPYRRLVSALQTRLSAEAATSFAGTARASDGATAIGPGMVYEDRGSASILEFRANVVVGAFALDTSTALALLGSLRPIN